MQLDKPKSNLRRVYVTAVDAETRRSKTTTLYETTPEAVIERVEEMVRRAEEVELARLEDDGAPPPATEGKNAKNQPVSAAQA